MFSSQYYHRKYTIDVQIAIVQFCDRNQIWLRRYHNYFEKQSTGIPNGYRSLCSFEYDTKGHRMECDALCGVELSGQKKIIAIELYNDEKVIRALKALEKYRQALSIGNPSLLFGVECNAHVLLFFRHQGMAKRVEERIHNDVKFTSFLPYFHLLDWNPDTVETHLKAVFKL